MYQWWVYLHVFGAFAFAAAHGVSAVAAFRIRAARDPAAVRTLLDLSSVSVTVMYVALLLLLIGGVAAGIAGGHFARGWIWASLALLVLTMVAMYMLATPFYKRLREAVGAESREPGLAAVTPAVGEADIQALVMSSRPMLLALVGLVGFALILWLMLFKPF